MKLSEWAKRRGISYRTAWRWFRQGYIKGHQMPTGTIIVEDEQRDKENGKRCIIYARVSDRQSKDNLDQQAERLKEYAISRGYQIVEVVKEIGSGVNDRREKLLKLFQRDDYMVEHKDRLTRFGFNYIEVLLEKQHIKVEVVNNTSDDRADLIEDLVSIIYSFSARLYGLRRGREKARKIKEELLDAFEGH
jgi:predicted site-specific integrase-resolvase